MINIYNDQNFKQVFDGVEIKTTVHGEQSLMTEFRMKAGSKLPNHAHDTYEQTGYLISGNVVLTIGGEDFDLKAGDSWCVPAGVKHSADILADSVAVEVFTHPREDYVALLDPSSR